ncbi:MAG: hypothetical protein WBZ36_04150 [Candidatus Nitrosopolaris sp.]
MVLVLLDCFTRFGGNQYINSSVTGRYEDHTIKKIVPPMMAQLELMVIHDLILFVKSTIPTNWNTSACRTAWYMGVRTLRMDLPPRV